MRETRALDRWSTVGWLKWGLFASLPFLLGACAETTLAIHGAKTLSQAQDPTAAELEAAEARIRRATMRPYHINGRWYYPKDDPDYDETGIASWYGEPFHGRPTATGETYDQNEISAAHKTLPLPSVVSVTNLENGRMLRVRVNDRGPFVDGRIIDLSRRAAQLLGFEQKGTARVRVAVADTTTLMSAADSDRERFVMAASEITREEQSVAAVPQHGVQIASLPADGSAAEAPTAVAAVKPAPAIRAQPAKATVIAAPAPVTGEVTQIPVNPTRIYVQVGSFTNYQFADRLRAKLSPLGGVAIQHALVDNADFFRVRIGPFEDVEAADRMLASALAAGADHARIVVD